MRERLPRSIYPDQAITKMSAPGPAGARRIRRATSSRRTLLANGAPPNCKLLGVGRLAADFEDAEHRIADFQIVDARAQCGGTFRSA
jgi:hypothetical protein